MGSDEKIVWSVPEGLPGVEVLTVENNRRPWCVFHQTYTICNVDGFTAKDCHDRDSTAEWTYRGRLHYSWARTLMLLEPGEVHRNTKTPPECNFAVVLIDPELVNRTANELGMRVNPHFRDAVSADPRLYQAFVRFHAALTQDASLLRQQSLLMQCMGAFLTGHCEQAPQAMSHAGRRRLQRSRDYLEEHCCEEVPLERLADLVGLSRFHFLRMFAREFGLPPHAYQMRLRIGRIRQLLKMGFPLRSIEAGFADQSHLIRHFKKAMGVTPGEYAATARKGPCAVSGIA